RPEIHMREFSLFTELPDWSTFRLTKRGRSSMINVRTGTAESSGQVPDHVRAMPHVEISATTHALAGAGLVDRYHLLVFPLLLGAGKRLFGEADQDATKLRLVEQKAYANGVQMQVFDVLR